MKETSVFILTLHAAILVFQLAAMFLFPSVRRALFGVYFILMPVGFSVFMDTDAWLIVGLVVAGLLWVLYWANHEVSRQAPVPRQSALGPQDQ